MPPHMPSAARSSVSSPPLPALLKSLALVALPLISLTGCGPDRNAFAPVCPTAGLIPALADVTRYAGPGPAHDVTDLIFQARVVAVNGSCEAGSDKAVLPAKLQVSLAVQRGPAMQGREADVPVFLAVTEGDIVRDKKVFAVHLMFPPNVDRMTITSPEIDLDLPVSGNKNGAAYAVITGFQLTPEELAVNRRANGG